MADFGKVRVIYFEENPPSLILNFEPVFNFGYCFYEQNSCFVWIRKRL